jgi:hypothetical protein
VLDERLSSTQLMGAGLVMAGMAGAIGMAATGNRAIRLPVRGSLR